MDVEEEEFSSISQSHMPVSPLRVVIPALIVQFAFGVSYTWGAVVPYVRAQDHWSPLVISAVFSGVSSGYGTGMIIGGWLADRYPPRLLCWIALGLLSLGYAIAFLFPSGFTFFTFYSFLALGIGGAIVLAGLLAAGASVLPRRIGTIGGALTGSYAFAAVILVPVVSQLAAAFGWINALRLLGSCMAVLAAAALLFIPPIPRPRYREHTRATRGASPLQLLLRKPILDCFAARNHYRSAGGIRLCRAIKLCTRPAFCPLDCHALCFRCSAWQRIGASFWRGCFRPFRHQPGFGGPPTAWFVLAGISVIGLLILVLRTVMLPR